MGGLADAGDTCLVRAVATVAAGGYTDVLVRAGHALTVIAGDLEFADNSSEIPTYPAEISIGGNASPIIPHNGNALDDNSVPVTWGDWEADGNCSVDADGVVTISGTAALDDECQVSAIATAENYNPTGRIELGDALTVVARVPFGAISAPVYSGDLTLRGYPVALDEEAVVTGNGSDAEITWTYKVTTDTICSVDSNTGTVSLLAAAAAGDTCSVVAVAGAPGYDPKDSARKDFTVKDTLTSLVWNTFPTEGTVGATIDLASNQPTVDPSDATVVVTASGDCDYSNSKVLSFTDATECVVTATASKAGYADFSRTYRITPAAGSLSPTWGSYAAVTVSTTAVNAPTITGVSGFTVVYAENSGSAGCTVAANGAVTGTAVGTCLVDATLSKTGYADAEKTYSISVGKGIQSAPPTNANPYGANPAVAAGATISIETALTAGEGALVYSLYNADTSHCTIDSSTGVVTGTTAASPHVCRVKAKYAGNANYLESSEATIATIQKLGTINVTGWGGYGTVRVAAGYTGGSPTVGFSPNPGSLTWTFVRLGSANNCQIATSGPARGKVRGINAGTNNCEIKLTLSRTNYASVSNTYTISVQKGNQGDPPTNGAPYGSNPTLVFGAAAKAVTNALTAGQGDLVYSVHTSDTSYCSVAADGAVTASAAGVDNDCRIQAKYAGNANWNESNVVTIATIGITGASWGTVTAPTYSAGTITFGDNAPTLTAGTPAASNPSADSWTWSATGPCSVAAGAVTISGAGTCVVKAVPVKAGYLAHAGVTATITVNKAANAGATTAVDAYDDRLKVAAHKSPNNNLPSGGEGGLAYRVHDSATPASSSASSACTIRQSDGRVTGVAGNVGSNCFVQAMWKGDGDHEASDWFSVSNAIEVVKGDQDPPSGIVSNPYGAGPQVAAGDTLEIVTAPTCVHGALVYRVSNTSYCSVDSAGTVTGNTAGVGNDCNVNVKCGATDDYRASSVERSVEGIRVVAPTIAGLSWSPSQSSGTVGVALTLDAMTTSTQGDTITYNKVSGSCSFADNTSPVLTITGVANCVVTASVARTGHSTWTSGQHSITVSKGTQSAPTWTGNPYGANPTLLFNAAAKTLSGTRPTGEGALEYQVLSTHATHCSVVAGSGAVTAKAAGAGNSCTIESRFAGNANYQASDWATVATISIRPASWTASTPPAYTPSSITFGDDAPTLNRNTPNSNPTADSWTWVSLYESVCTVDSRGALTIVGDGNCVVNATPIKAGYSDASAVGVTVVVTAVNFTSFTGFAYSSATATVGEAVPTLTAPTASPSADSITYSTTAANTVCEVDSSSGALTIAGAGTCTVKATATKAGYNDESATFEIEISPAGPQDMSFSTTPEASYTGNLVYITSNLHTGGDVSQTADFTLPGTDDDGTVAITWHFSVAGFDSSNTAKNNVCSVKNADATNADHSKIYAHANAALNDICRVTVVGRASGYNDYTSVATVDLAVKKLGRWASGNEPSYTDDTTHAQNNPPLRSNTIVVGSTASASGGTLIDLGGGEEATYTHTLTGMDNDGSPADNDNVCSLDATSRQLGTGSAASAGDTCVVRFVASSNVYHDVVMDVTVNVLGTQAGPTQSTAGAAYGSPSALTVGQTKSISTAPSGGGGHGALEYRNDFDGGSLGCSVASDGEVTATGAHLCRVQARWAGNNEYTPSPWVTIWEFTPVP